MFDTEFLSKIIQLPCDRFYNTDLYYLSGLSDDDWRTIDLWSTILGSKGARVMMSEAMKDYDYQSHITKKELNEFDEYYPRVCYRDKDGRIHFDTFSFHYSKATNQASLIYKDPIARFFGLETSTFEFMVSPEDYISRFRLSFLDDYINKFVRIIHMLHKWRARAQYPLALECFRAIAAELQKEKDSLSILEDKFSINLRGKQVKYSFGYHIYSSRISTLKPSDCALTIRSFLTKIILDRKQYGSRVSDARINLKRMKTIQDLIELVADYTDKQTQAGWPRETNNLQGFWFFRYNLYFDIDVFNDMLKEEEKFRNEVWLDYDTGRRDLLTINDDNSVETLALHIRRLAKGEIEITDNPSDTGKTLLWKLDNVCATYDDYSCTATVCLSDRIKKVVSSKLGESSIVRKCSDMFMTLDIEAICTINEALQSLSVFKWMEDPSILLERWNSWTRPEEVLNLPIPLWLSKIRYMLETATPLLSALRNRANSKNLERNNDLTFDINFWASIDGNTAINVYLGVVDMWSDCFGCGTVHGYFVVDDNTFEQRFRAWWFMAILQIQKILKKNYLQIKEDFDSDYYIFLEDFTYNIN